MAVNRADLYREIEIGISKDLAVKRGTKEFAEEVRDYAKRLWLESGPHPYETHHFVETIHAEKRRDAAGHWPHWAVVSDDEKANMLENGTGPDKPGSKSPYGPNTPTPEFAIFARTAHHYRGTAP